MAKLPKISALWAGFRTGKAPQQRSAWGKHSHIDMLADGLSRDRAGWVVGENSIRRNGVVIAWKGPLAGSGTSVSVEMDGQRFRITSDEARKLRDRLGEFLKAGNSG